MSSAATNPLRQTIFWAPVPGFPDYAVSDQGDVVSYKKETSGKLMTPSLKATSYLQVTLMRYGEQVTRMVHRLVYRAFRGPIQAGLEVMHLDGNPSDNQLENLKEGTPLENSQMKQFHGTQCRGAKHGRAKLTEADVLEIREIYPALSYKKLGVKFGVSDNQIMLIVHRRSWTHV